MASQPGVPSPDQKAIQDLEKQLVRATGRQYRLPPGLSGITYKRIASQLAIHQEEANTSNENVGDLLISHIKILGIEPEPIASTSRV